ncbi:hypothetical protein ACIQM4_27525 [Streptomyces sp. NPDC091272]|uniref:hypothetical protein n=1 Tax=Streptomyces sp. NPDC091272 TaxID=3365981 RepID=UPI0037F7E75D
MKAQELPAVAGTVARGRPGTDTTAVRTDAGTTAGRTDAGRDTGTGRDTDPGTGAVAGRGAGPAVRQLWVEEPALRWRLPDPVRTSAVRAVIIVSLTLIQAMVAYLSTLAGSWLAFPMTVSSVASTVAATWGVLDVWITRQVWNQRNGVVSVPSSTARRLRRERRKARRTARKDARIQDRGRGNAGRLSRA